MDRMIFKICVLAATILSSLNLTSCKDESSEGISITTNINPNGMITVASSNSGSTNFKITSNADWKITVASGDWLTVSPANGKGDAVVNLSFTSNDNENSRTAAFTIVASLNGESRTLNYTLAQAGSSGVIDTYYLQSSTMSVNNISGNGETGKKITVTSNIDWKADTEDDWITLKTSSGSGDGTIEFDVAPNPVELSRNGQITISAANEGQAEDIVISVTQLEKDKEAPDPYLTVSTSSIGNIEAAGQSGLSFEVSSNVEWSVSVDSGASGWVVINTASGSDDGTVRFDVSANTSTLSRTATISVSDNAGKAPTATVAVSQKGKTDSGTTYKWAETPGFTTTSSTQYVTHYITLNGKTARNYSLLWDRNEKIAYWVAFPMHPSYDGSVKRKDNYQYDPVIPQSDQPVLSKSYEGNYSRGHQIASSDRLVSSEANTQTFYYTNMTPQNQTFNGGIWNKLEQKIQNNWTCTDTLYVVTGAVLNYPGAVKYTTDKNGTKVAIPSHYYKVMLRSKNGNTGRPISELSASEIICVGFLFEHEANWGTKDNPTSAHMKSVEYIEQFTGYEFFTTVPEEVKKTFKASDWGM